MDNEFVKLRASQSKTSSASIISAGSSSQEPLQKPSEESLIHNSLNISNIFSFEMA